LKQTRNLKTYLKPYKLKEPIWNKCET